MSLSAVLLAVERRPLAEKALDKAGIGTGGYHWISGRDYAQKQLLIDVLSSAFSCDSTDAETLGYLKAAGILVIDDFHHLLKSVRDEIGLKLKRWGELGIRVFVVGIASLNKALLDLDSELAIRNDSYEIGTQNNEFIESVIKLGEDALHFTFAPECKRRFISASLGVPSAIQQNCRVACTRSDLFETCRESRVMDVFMEEIKDAVLRNYESKFQNRLIGLAKGKQQARSVHNTYFEIVKQICTLEVSEIPISELYSRIVKPVVDPVERKKKSTSFYNCLNNFSFAGEDRVIVEQFREAMNAAGYTTFYDFDEQHKLWGENLRRKLGDVYAHDAQFMVVF